MIVERTLQERTKEKLKVVGLVLAVSPILYYLDIGQHNITVSIIGMVLSIAMPFILLPIGMLLLNINTDYYKIIPDDKDAQRSRS
jgi:hypothetical protein